MEITALKLARECQVPILLPFLLYRCCLFPTSDIADSVVYPNGIAEATLDVDDRLRCLAAKSKLQELMRSKYTTTFLYRDGNVDKSCMTRNVCARLRLRLLKDLENDIADKGFCNFLDLQELKWSYLDGLCVACRGTSFRDFKVAQIQLWNDLPEIFEFEDWDTLRSEMGDDLLWD